MRAILIDDEAHCILSLTWTLKEYCPNVEIVATGNNGEEGLKLIKEYKPDLVFLDIEMPILNGLDMLAAIERIDFHIIFTTAFNQYAINAIKLSATDYLLKPIDKDDLILAINKIDTSKNTDINLQKIHNLKHNLGVVPALQKIIVPTDEGVLFLDIGHIIYLEASSNYTILHFDNQKKIISSRTLKEFEEILPPELFFRCHRSYIINLQFIQKYIKGEGGFIELKNGQMVELSRRKKAEFIQLIGL